MMAQRILVIDDDAALLTLYQLLFQAEGYEVLTSNTLIEDVQEVERLAPTVVLLDLTFGGRPAGLLLLKALRAYPPTSQLPIILATAALPEVTMHKAWLQQAEISILHKPFALEELFALIPKRTCSSPE